MNATTHRACGGCDPGGCGQQARLPHEIVPTPVPMRKEGDVIAQPFDPRRVQRGAVELFAGVELLTGVALLTAGLLAGRANAQERYSTPAPGVPPAAAQPAPSGGVSAAAPGAAPNIPNTDGQAPANRAPFGTVSPQATGNASGGTAAPGGAASAYGRPPVAGGTSNGAMVGTGLKPSAMMRALLSPPAGSQLRGQPISLQDAVAGARSRGDQTQRVEAYWDLCSGVADYYLGLREQEELRRLRTLVPRVGPTWSQAEIDLNIRVGTSQRAALASQLRLASLIGGGSNNLPLPADAPHCASYDTQFEFIFAGSAPAEARELAAVLPARYVELKGAAAAVTRGEQWVESVARGDSDGTGTLRALELLALQRRAFVQIARDYNRRIARYAELASPGQLSSVQLTAMLINAPASSTAKRPWSASPPRNRQSSATPAPPPTFVESSTPALQPISEASPDGSAVRPASVAGPETQPAADGERSLLVLPTERP